MGKPETMKNFGRVRKNVTILKRILRRSIYKKKVFFCVIKITDCSEKDAASIMRVGE